MIMPSRQYGEEHEMGSHEVLVFSAQPTTDCGGFGESRRSCCGSGDDATVSDSRLPSGRASTAPQSSQNAPLHCEANVEADDVFAGTRLPTPRFEPTMRASEVQPGRCLHSCRRCFSPVAALIALLFLGGPVATISYGAVPVIDVSLLVATGFVACLILAAAAYLRCYVLLAALDASLGVGESARRPFIADRTVPAGATALPQRCARVGVCVCARLVATAVLASLLVHVSCQTAITNGNFGTAVTEWVTSPTTAAATYGNIAEWDVSAMSNMYQLFYNKPTFNADIGKWNVASVSNMRNMFDGATAFNGNIGSWNVGSAVSTMRGMFYGATAFNQNIGSWNTASATNMMNVFYGATAFNRSIASWNTASATTMAGVRRF
jgi:surface protein